MTLASAKRYSVDPGAFTTPSPHTFHVPFVRPALFTVIPLDAVPVFTVHLVQPESEEQGAARSKLAQLRSLASTLPEQSERGDSIDQAAELESYTTSIIEAENLQR